MQEVISSLQIVSLFLIPLSLLESLLLYRRKKADLKESFANLSSNILGRIIKFYFTGTIIYTVLFAIKKQALFAIPVNLLTILATLVLMDFVYYWKHRWMHEVRLLWTTHSIHHSSYQFNLSTALRLPWLGVFVNATFYAPLAWLGFDPLTLMLSHSLILLYQYPIHTQGVGKLPVLDKYFNTPSNHRVHHGANPQYLDKNHGGILIIWDRMFGTYQQELAEVRYGLTTPVNSYNPFFLQLAEPWSLLKDTFAAPGLLNKLKVPLKGPGWVPSQGKN